MDRDGLKHVPDMMYMMFVSIEEELRVYLSCAQSQSPSAVNLIEAKSKLIQNEDVNFYWSMVSSYWQEDVAVALLVMLVDHWIKVRGLLVLGLNNTRRTKGSQFRNQKVLENNFLPLLPLTPSEILLTLNFQFILTFTHTCSLFIFIMCPL